MTLPTTPNGRWVVISPISSQSITNQGIAGSSTLAPQVNEVGFTLYLGVSVTGSPNLILQAPSGAQLAIPPLANVPFYPPLIDERTGLPLINERTGQVITSDIPDGTVLSNGYYVVLQNNVIDGPLAAYVTSTGDLDEGGLWQAFFGIGAGGVVGQFVVQGITP